MLIVYSYCLTQSNQVFSVITISTCDWYCLILLLVIMSPTNGKGKNNSNNHFNEDGFVEIPLHDLGLSQETAGAETETEENKTKCFLVSP